MTIVIGTISAAAVGLWTLAEINKPKPIEHKTPREQMTRNKILAWKLGFKFVIKSKMIWLGIAHNKSVKIATAKVEIR